MASPRLEYVDQAGNTRATAITASPFRLGRSSGSHLVVRDAGVSRFHADIVRKNGRFTLRDQDSRAGTFVNESRISEHLLRAGDRIRLGKSVDMVFALGTNRDDTRADSSSSSSSTALSSLRQTSALLDGLRAVGTTRVLDQILELLLDSAIAVSGAERALVMLVTPTGDLELRVGRGRDKRSLLVSELETSRKIPKHVLATGETRLVEDLQESWSSSDHDETLALGIRNVLCTPLTIVQVVDGDDTAPDDSRIGVLYLDSQERKPFRSSSIRRSLETLAAEAASAIQSARLYRDSLERAEMQRDLQTAYEFQQELLPQPPNLGFFTVAARMDPCRMIGGDFFEYVTLGDDALGFTLGDVSGKGAPAGLLGARIQELFSRYAPGPADPASTISQINETLVHRALASRFVTMVYGILFPDGRLLYCNAGHNLPVLLSHDGTRRLDVGGTVVGLLGDAVYDKATVQLAPGDLLLVFSDGISEAVSASGEEFGDARIIHALERASKGLEPRAVLDQLFEELETFTRKTPQADDMTALVLRYGGVEENVAEVPRLSPRTAS